MKTKSLLAILATIVCAGSMCASVPTHAADAAKKELKVEDTISTTKTLGKDEKDANIKEDAPAKGDNPKSTSENPREGKRGGLGDIRVYNETPWHLHVYMNGKYEGTLSPWCYFDIPVTPGRAVLYGKVFWDNGTTSSAGPRSTYINNGEVYSWHCHQ